MIRVGRVGESSKETDGVSDVQSAYDVGVDQFTQDVAIGESVFIGEHSSFNGLLRGAFQGHQSVRSGGIERNHLGVFTGIGDDAVLRRVPSMRLHHSVDIRFGADLDIVTGLEDIDSVVPLEHSFGHFDSHSGVFGLDMVLQDLDELLRSALVWGGRGEVVDLSANEDFNSVDRTDAYVPFMGSVPEAHLVDEDISDHAFPKYSGFGMAL